MAIVPPLNPPYGWVTHRSLLRRMEKEGWIAEPADYLRPTGKPWGNANGYHYVKSAPYPAGLCSSWRNGAAIGKPLFDFSLRYVDGCFLPFVFFRDRVISKNHEHTS